jgi:hypothetical protein
MNIDYLRGYYATFKFLDSIWEDDKNSELGLLLGTMNPYIWEDKLPIDKTIITNWIAIFNEIAANGKMTVDGCFEAMIRFVKMEEEQLRLNLTEIINKLTSVDSSDINHKKMWTNWIDSLINQNGD